MCNVNAKLNIPRTFNMFSVHNVSDSLVEEKE